MLGPGAPKSLQAKPSYRRQEFLISVLATVFAVMFFVYLQIMPTWPILAISLSLGGCAYALTNA